MKLNCEQPAKQQVETDLNISPRLNYRHFSDIPRYLSVHPQAHPPPPPPRPERVFAKLPRRKVRLERSELSGHSINLLVRLSVSLGEEGVKLVLHLQADAAAALGQK